MLQIFSTPFSLAQQKVIFIFFSKINKTAQDLLGQLIIIYIQVNLTGQIEVRNILVILFIYKQHIGIGIPVHIFNIQYLYKYMKKSDFYDKIKLLLESRHQTPLQCSYYWPKDQQETAFNKFLLGTLKQYIDSYDIVQLLRIKLNKNQQSDNTQLWKKLEQMGQGQFAKKIKTFFSKGSKANSQNDASGIANQLTNLSGNIIIPQQKSLQKRVKRLVFVLNILQRFIVITSKEDSQKTKDFDPKQIKKYETDRIYYLSSLSVQMKKIEDYRKQSLKLRELLAFQAAKNNSSSKPADYCNRLQGLISDYNGLKSSLFDIATILEGIMIKQKEKKENMSLKSMIEKLPHTKIKQLLEQLQRHVSQDSPQRINQIGSKIQKSSDQNPNTYVQYSQGAEQKIQKNQKSLLVKQVSPSKHKAQIFEGQFQQAQRIQPSIDDYFPRQKAKMPQQPRNEQVNKIPSDLQSRITQLSQKVKWELAQLKSKYSARQKELTETNQRLTVQIKYNEQRYYHNFQNTPYVRQTQALKKQLTEQLQDVRRFYQSEVVKAKQAEKMKFQMIKKEIECLNLQRILSYLISVLRGKNNQAEQRQRRQQPFITKGKRQSHQRFETEQNQQNVRAYVSQEKKIVYQPQSVYGSKIK